MKKLLLSSLFTLVLISSSGCTNAKNERQQVDATAENINETEVATELTAPVDGRIMPSDKGIVYLGRISFKNPDAPEMGFTGAQIYANFTGTSIKMRMKPNSGFFAVVIDSTEHFMVQSKKDTLINLKSGLKPGTHSIAISQCTEAADVNFPVFYGFQLDKDASLAEAPVLHSRKIEFIGNSITCGKGAQDNTKQKERDDIAFENWYITYDAEVARRLNAQCQVVARSGIGIYRNNGGRYKGDTETMSYYFTRTLLKPDSEMWDFSKFTPHLVCINLGTNDTSQSYDVNLFKEGAKKFLKDVRTHYPDATIVVMTGPMRSGKRLLDQKAGLDYAVNQLKAEGDKNVHRFDIPYDTGQYGYGTGHHPSVGEHTHMADLLTPYLKELMKW